MASDPQSGVASLTTSWSEIVPAREDRTMLVLQNLDLTSYVEVGGPTSSAGYRIPAGGEIDWYCEYRDESVKGAVWGKAEAGTVNLAWLAGHTDPKPFGGWTGGPR